jgi:hypothetical protein
LTVDHPKALVFFNPLPSVGVSLFARLPPSNHRQRPCL